MMTLGGGPFYESRAGTCHKDLDLDSENFKTEFIPPTYSLLTRSGPNVEKGHIRPASAGLATGTTGGVFGAAETLQERLCHTSETAK